MRRRDLLKGATAAVAFSTASASARTAAPASRVRPGDAGWPSDADWQRLSAAIGGRLARVRPVEDVFADPVTRRISEDGWRTLANPYAVQDCAGATQTTGWVDGWETAPSVYAAEPETAADVAAVIAFARDNDVRLVVRGGAHSYLGQSCAPDSLLLWTRRLNAIALHDDFVPQGCEGLVVSQPAVSVGSGARFMELYDAVTVRHGRYVQGGGCTSVGVGGFLQGGGFGSFSKYGGLGAASLLEAEIVTADGTIRTANARQHSDLFEALKGGGAGFGVTTRLTLATRPLPARFGFYGRSVRAASAQAFERLIEAFCGFAETALLDPHWGEQVKLGPDLRLTVDMVHQGVSADEARALWAPFDAWLAAHPQDIAEASPVRATSIPARRWWDFDDRRTRAPGSIVVDERPEAPGRRFWWSGNSIEVGVYFSGYESMWLHERLLRSGERPALARALAEAAQRFSLSLHFNKGLAGATAERRAEARETSIHPDAVDAFALVIIAGGVNGVRRGQPGREPDRAALRAERQRIAEAIAPLRRLSPDAGSYSAEMSYFEPRWRETAWGPHYARLLAVKRAYDPAGLFTGHHQVGSEQWSADGFERRAAE